MQVNPELLQDLVNEIELLQSLDHPNVIKLHEYFYDGDTIMESSNLFLVMELCEGGELFDRLHMQTHSHYTEAKAAGIVTMMLKAIAYIHSKGVSHRDLKLENFLFESRADDSNLKLIDFGLSARYTAPGGVQRMTTMVGTPYYIAPEVLTAGRAGYTPACDMWSLGVITYMLLSGTPPFKGRHDADVLNSVKRGKYNLSGRRWEHVSDAAKDFIRRLLVYRPSGRMSASAALDDPWITRAAAQRARREPSGSTQLDEEIVGNLRAFTHFSALKRAALEAIAFQVAAPKLAKLRSVFLDMDKDRTGLISLAEMQEVLVERGGMQPAEVQDIFSRLDQDGQDTISYSEFLAATLSKRYYMREGRIRAAFQKLDVDGSGYITPENLREILGDDFTPERVAEMIREADTLGDGRISYQEFLALFREEAGAALLPGATPTPRHAASGSGTRAYYDDMGLGERFAALDESGASVQLEGGPQGSTPRAGGASTPLQVVPESKEQGRGGAAVVPPPPAPVTSPPPGAEYYADQPGMDDDAYAFLASEPVAGGYAYGEGGGPQTLDDMHLYVGGYATDEAAARRARREAKRERRRRHRAGAAPSHAAQGSASESSDEDDPAVGGGRTAGTLHRDHHRAQGYASGSGVEGASPGHPGSARGAGSHAVGGSVIVMSGPQRRQVERHTQRGGRG